MSKPIEAIYRLYGAVDGKTCGECSHIECHRYDKNYYKCSVYGISRSEATDWAKRWTACGMFNKEVANVLPVKDWLRACVRKPVQSEGQTEIEVTP